MVGNMDKGVNDLSSLQGKPQSHDIEIYDRDGKGRWKADIGDIKVKGSLQPCVRDGLRARASANTTSSFMAIACLYKTPTQLFHSSNRHKYSKDTGSYVANSRNRARDS